MCLLDDLLEASASVDPSLQPSGNQTTALLGSVVHYLEHGDAFLTAAADGPQAVSDLIAAGPATAKTSSEASSTSSSGKK